MEQMIRRDEGYDFGLGVFETIAVEKNRPEFLEEHLNRLAASARTLRINNEEADYDKIAEEVRKISLTFDEQRYAVKVSLSANNLLFSTRPAGYKREDYERGFCVAISPVRRNETSPLTFHKTTCYGDNILEKRRYKKLGIDEPVFLNSKGELSEGAVSNLFFCREGKLFTPAKSCGLLPGIMRNYLLTHYPVVSCHIEPDEICLYEEAFLTNSLMGIMPIAEFDGKYFSKRDTIKKLQIQLQQDLKKEVET